MQLYNEIFGNVDFRGYVRLACFDVILTLLSTIHKLRNAISAISHDSPPHTPMERTFQTFPLIFHHLVIINYTLDPPPP